MGEVASFTGLLSHLTGLVAATGLLLLQACWGLQGRI